MSVNRLNLLSSIINFNKNPSRLISITFPMSFKYIFSKSRTLTIIGCNFLAGFLIALPVLFPCCRMPYYFEYLAVIYEDPLTWLVSIFFRTHSYHLNIKEKIHAIWLFDIFPYRDHSINVVLLGFCIVADLYWELPPPFSGLRNIFIFFFRHRYLDLTVSIVPCPVMLFAYSFIFMKVRRNNKNMAVLKWNASIRRDSESQARNKVNTTELRLLIQVPSYPKI